MSTHQVAKKAWREGLSSQRDRKLSQGRRGAKSLGFLAAACSLFCFSSCHSSVLKKKKKTHGCFNSSMRRANGNTGGTGAACRNKNGRNSRCFSSPFSTPLPFQTNRPWNKAKCKQNIGNAKPQCLARSQERQSSQLESTRGAEQLRAGEAIPRLGASAWLTVGFFTHVSELKLYVPDFQK